jgi:hypothetical protein
MSIVAAKPPRLRKNDQLHLAGIAILHIWRRLDQHPGPHLVSLIRDREVAAPRKNIIGAHNLLTHHKGVVPLLDLDIRDFQISLAQWSKLIPTDPFSRK